jgi:TRAP-type C4-dicarboxylate transport system substrate-binding protein
VWLAAVTAVALTGCAASNASETTDPPPDTAAATTTEPADDHDVDKAGNKVTSSTEPVKLTATYTAQLERPRGQVLKRYVEEVDKASGGAIEIDVTLDNGESEQQWQDGDFDIILAPARTLDTMGVHTFDVLSVPFVVQDDDQADRVATSDVADTMLAGLDAIDATGLVLAPITQEHLQLAGDEPLRTIDQLQTGIRMSPHSDAIAALFEAMGGHVAYDLNGDDWDAAIENGEALASEFPTALATVHGGLSMATNFTLFYDFGIVAIRNDSLAKLTDEQADMLRSAGEATLQRQIDERIREEQAFAKACSDGATLTVAPYSLMAEVGYAVDDVILTMFEDPAARELYDAVRQAAGKNMVPKPVECAWSAVSDYTPPDPPSPIFPEGVYRAKGSTQDELFVRGAPTGDAANQAADYWEWTIEDGTITLSMVRDNTSTEAISAPYTVDGAGRIVTDGWATLTWRESPGGIVLEELPIDDPQARWDQWEVAMYGVDHLIRAE